MKLFPALSMLFFCGLLALILASCESSKEPKMEDGFLVCTIADIVENPADFHLKKVKVPGVFTYEFENVCIRRNWPNSADKIWLDFSGSVTTLSPEILVSLKEEKIVVSGIYHMDQKGHLDNYQGTIQCLGISN
ncbi:hypothetical protein [Hymenobacter psychrophilus]|uniref:Lipoprotein n=1 Tax=Hymenobacter psychrophilus TaxID=651662 RepID=A0A1H3GRK6_9BACT|nr:hypothetical protein [Hymenobacter psychrophilus]SDY05595.1 hypothetical protein SAMN04488069_105132 [Hymenobacter psychrophilus]